ncbi:hypothetical protein KKG65_01465, partial [Patescibacteria group bacterium]|nr:hypothetical protein [Patescibacteria group bacterium]
RYNDNDCTEYNFRFYIWVVDPTNRVRFWFALTQLKTLWQNYFSVSLRPRCAFAQLSSTTNPVTRSRIWFGNLSTPWECDLSRHPRAGGDPSST